MLNWQVHSAIGRGRPLCVEFARAADGVAASLRQFHVSISLAGDEEVKKKGPRISRVSNITSKIQNPEAQASSRSVRQVTGIDARSLGESLKAIHPSGANPPLVRPQSRSSGGFHGSGGLKGSSGFHGSGRGQTVNSARGRGSLPFRRDGNNTNAGARGGFGGSGRGGGGFRSRGRARGGNKGGQRGGRRRIESALGMEGEHMVEYTPEELDYLAAKEAAQKPQPVPFTPQDITITSLTPHAPQIPVSTLGASSIIDSQLRHLASRPPDTYTRIETLASRLLLGSPVFFESASERAEVLRAAAAQPGQKKGSIGLEGMGEEERRKVEERLLRGDYGALGNVGGNVGVLRDVGRLAGKNESYLERDVVKVVEKTRTLVPSRFASPGGAAGIARGRV